MEPPPPPLPNLNIKLNNSNSLVKDIVYQNIKYLNDNNSVLSQKVNIEIELWNSLQKQLAIIFIIVIIN